MAEGIALTCRCVAIIVLLAVHSELGLAIFAAAHVLYACVLCAAYYSFYLRNLGKQGLLEPVLRCPYLPQTTTCCSPGGTFCRVPSSMAAYYIARLHGCSGHGWWMRAVTLGFVKQSVLKQFLTEGERCGTGGAADCSCHAGS